MYSLRSIKTGTGDSRELHLLGMARMIGPAFHTPDRAFNPCLALGWEMRIGGFGLGHYKKTCDWRFSFHYLRRSYIIGRLGFYPGRKMEDSTRIGDP